MNAALDNNFCPVCNASAVIYYKSLVDLLFGVSGCWDLVRCSNPKCELVWLVPKPKKEEIKNFYVNYYTHGIGKKRAVTFNNLIEKYIYKLLKVLYSLLRKVLFINFERKNLDYMYLKRKQGKVLEIGCGNGERLFKLRKIGWDVEGTEIDEKAIKVALEKYGVEAYLGDIRDLKLEKEYYDAIIMNHVIEHIYEPIDFLKRCKELLKEGGKLIITTPNFESYSHKKFGIYWRGLEPPRHLYLYNCNSLKSVLSLAGFHKIHTWTSTAKSEFIIRDSMELYLKSTKQKKSAIYLYTIPWYYQVLFRIMNFFSKNKGDECVCIAKK